MSVHVAAPRPFVDRNTWPGVVGVASLNPEKVAYTVFPVASAASGRTCVTARLGNGALSIAVHAATADPSTVVETLIRPSDAPA